MYYLIKRKIISLLHFNILNYIKSILKEMLIEWPYVRYLIKYEVSCIMFDSGRR